MNKLLVFFNIALLLIVFVGSLYIAQIHMNDSNVSQTSDMDVSSSEDVILPAFTNEENIEEARAVVFETYSNDNYRIVGAIIDSIDGDILTVKTYRAGEGTTSIVEEKKISLMENIPVFVTTISLDGEGEDMITEKSEADALQAGDRINIETAQLVEESGGGMYTAVLITKEELIVPEPEFLEEPALGTE